MKFITNLEKKVIFQDQEIEVVFVKDDDGIVQHIDFVGFCEECEEPHIFKRFVPLTEDALIREIIMEYEDDIDEEDEDDDDEDIENYIINNILADKKFIR